MKHITVAAPTTDGYRAVARAGFDGVDLTLAGYAERNALLSGEYKSELADKYRRLCALGLCVGQTHLCFWPSHITPPDGGSYPAQEEYLLPMLLREIELTASLGCHTAVMHPYFLQDGEREVSRAGNLHLIEKLLPTLEACGVTLALENIYGLGGSDAHHERAEDLLYYTEHFASPHVGICLDTGHALIRKQKPIELVRAYGKHLVALHLHSSLARCDNHAIPTTTNGDSLDWGAFCTALNEIGYAGNFNLEIRPPKAMPAMAREPYYQLAYAVAVELCKNLNE